MKKTDIAVIGGSTVGLMASVSCRRLYPEKHVTQFRQEEHVMVPCGLPYIFGTLGTVEKNIVSDAKLEKSDVEIIKSKVVDIDRERKCVTTASGDVVGYEKLILGTGSLPIRLPIPGFDKEDVFIVKRDVAYLEHALDVINKAEDIIIIGGGFVGIEFADECKRNRNSNVTIVEALPHCLQLALDEEFCLEAENVLEERGVNILVNKRVEAILGDDRVSGVRLASGEELKADVIIVGVGTMPNTELAKKAGLQIGPTKAIQVDRYMRTLTDIDIFACGDCAEKFSFFSGKVSSLMLASIANIEARIASVNLFNIRYANPGTIGVFSTEIGERTFGNVGLTESAARKDGFDVVVSQTQAIDRHPRTMPGATMTKSKLIFSRDDGLLLGGGISGSKCAGEIVNIISACIQNKMTAYNIAHFQMGTHPALTAGTSSYHLVEAADLAAKTLRSNS